MNETILHELNPEQEKSSFQLYGKAFHGIKNISHKDNSYTATLWFVVLYMPIFPYDTYRIFGNPPTTALPHVYALGSFINVNWVKIGFDWRQAISSFLTFWFGFAIYVVLLFFLYLELGILLTLFFGSLAILISDVIVVLNNRQENAKHAADAQAVEKEYVPSEEKPILPVAPKPIKQEKLQPNLKPDLEPHFAKIEPLPVPPSIPVPEVRKPEPVITPPIKAPIAPPLVHAIAREKINPPTITEKIQVEAKPEPIPEPIKTPKVIEHKKEIIAEEPVEPKEGVKPIHKEEKYAPAPIQPQFAPVMATNTKSEKFDPSSILDINRRTYNFYSNEQLDRGVLSTVDLLGFINIACILLFMLLDIYAEIEGSWPEVLKFFEILTKYKIISLTGLSFSFWLVFKKNYWLSVPLAVISIILYFGYHQALFKFLYDLAI